MGMILVYEAGRPERAGHGLHSSCLPLKKIVEVNEMMASLAMPSKVIGVAMNSRLLTPDEAEAERERVRSELGLPVCDVIRHGPAICVDAILAFRQKLFPHLGESGLVRSVRAGRTRIGSTCPSNTGTCSPRGVVPPTHAALRIKSLICR